ncbi:transporter [Rhizobium helianthi]|uniref:Transporter n=1 Tax=Rhizobium helianthi TaxID=1132695 RepID=A0ABW4M8S1_9HYPH
MLSAGIALADENGSTITPFGIGDFGAGQSPPPTPYGTFAISGSYYHADMTRDGRGDKVDNNFDLTVKSISLTYVKMFEAQLFGANYGFAASIPFLNIGGNVTAATPTGLLNLANESGGIGDIQIYPIILQWDLTKNWFVNATLQVQAPTGEFNTREAFTPGVNHWAIAPVVSFTYISDSGFEISMRNELNFNTRNPTTRYTSGVGFKNEFALGQHFGPWTVGIGGYAYQQITDDSAPNLTSGNRGRVFAAGPAITYNEPGMPAIGLHAYQEFGARNRSEGYNVNVRVAFTF